MSSFSTFRFISIPAIAIAAAFACSDPPPAVTPDSELPLKVPPPSTAEPIAAPEPSAAPAASAAPEASASASAAAPPAPPQSSGRPPLLKSDPKEISDTFGVSPGSKLELGDDKEMVVLRIPEGSLETGTNITFKFDPKGKPGGMVIGKIYHLTAVVPPSGTPSRVKSVGEPFRLEFPAGNKKDANLAIGEPGTKFRVIAPKRVDDSTNTAYFELTELYDFTLHITTRAPTEPKP